MLMDMSIPFLTTLRLLSGYQRLGATQPMQGDVPAIPL
jgi:hypothetical protein